MFICKYNIFVYQSFNAVTNTASEINLFLAIRCVSEKNVT